MEINKDKIPLGFQFDVYDRHAEAGTLLVVTLRKEGKVVGYFWGFLIPHIHHKTCLTLMMDLYWVNPSVRGKGLPGVKLLREVEAEARRRGAQQMFFGSKLHKDSSRLFERSVCRTRSEFRGATLAGSIAGHPGRRPGPAA